MGVPVAHISLAITVFSYAKGAAIVVIVLVAEKGGGFAILKGFGFPCLTPLFHSGYHFHYFSPLLLPLLPRSLPPPPL